MAINHILKTGICAIALGKTENTNVDPHVAASPTGTQCWKARNHIDEKTAIPANIDVKKFPHIIRRVDFGISSYESLWLHE